MTDTWGPALDAEIAHRREDLLNDLSSGLPRLARRDREQRSRLRVLLGVRRTTRTPSLAAAGTVRPNRTTPATAR